MSEQNLDHLISRLNDLFPETQQSASQQRLLQELERHRHEAGLSEAEQKRPIEPLEAMLEEFESDHPQVSAVLGQIINALKNMGV